MQDAAQPQRRLKQGIGAQSRGGGSNKLRENNRKITIFMRARGQSSPLLPCFRRPCPVLSKFRLARKKTSQIDFKHQIHGECFLNAKMKEASQMIDVLLIWKGKVKLGFHSTFSIRSLFKLCAIVGSSNESRGEMQDLKGLVLDYDKTMLIDQMMSERLKFVCKKKVSQIWLGKIVKQLLVKRVLPERSRKCLKKFPILFLVFCDLS